LNASEDREGDFRAYYTPAAREIVERRYESDFRAFQYGWDEEDCITSSLIWRDPFEPPADLTEYG
jgi:hypothetical protein